MDLRIETLRPRTVAVVRHQGTEETVEETRRPLYRHLIMNELVGGPSIIRFPADGGFDLLVVTHLHFEGDEVARVEDLPGGPHAVADWEGPPTALPRARQEFLEAVRSAGMEPAGSLLQVHHMDPVEGHVEEQFQLPIR